MLSSRRAESESEKKEAKIRKAQLPHQRRFPRKLKTSMDKSKAHKNELVLLRRPFQCNFNHQRTKSIVSEAKQTLSSNRLQPWKKFPSSDLRQTAQTQHPCLIMASSHKSNKAVTMVNFRILTAMKQLPMTRQHLTLHSSWQSKRN